MQNKIDMVTTAKKRGLTLQSISVGLLLLYIIFSYIAQKTLLPPVLHSIIMYSFVGVTVLLIILKDKLTITKFSLWLACMVLLACVSLAWATDVTFSAIYTMFVALVLTTCIIAVIDTYKKLDACIYSFIIGCDLMGVLIIVTGQISGLEEGERLGNAITGNANAFSALLMVACILAFWKAIYSKSIVVKLLCFASAVFDIVLMAFSGGRKTIIAVIICLVWFIVTKDANKSLKLLRNILIACAALVAIYVAFTEIPLLHELVGERFEGLFDFISGGQSSVSSDETRAKLIEIGLEKWLECPIWGYGIDTFKYYNRSTLGHFYYAHNNYVEILFDLGIIGFVLYYGFFAYMTNGMRKSWKDNTPYKALGIGLIIMTLAYDIGGISFYSTFPLVILAFAFVTMNIKDVTAFSNEEQADKLVSN